MANELYTPSQKIIDLIAEFEGYKPGVYYDSKGLKTVGYGFLFSALPKSDQQKYAKGMTQPQAKEYFTKVAIPSRVSRFIQSTPNIDKLNQDQKDALFSLFYNIGEYQYRNKSPKLMEGLRKLDFNQVVNNIDHGYNDSKSKGLRRRRDVERSLFGYHNSITPNNTIRDIVQSAFEIKPNYINPVQSKVPPFKSGGKIGFYQEGGTYIPSNGDPYQIFNGFTPYTDGTEITVPAVPSDELIPIPEGNYYKVKSGDSLWAIAHKHGMSLSKLLKMNPELSIKSVIHPGDRIYTGDYTVIKKQQRTQQRTQQKTQWRELTKEWDKKAPYEPAKSQAEYEYRRATSPEFAQHQLAEYPYVVPESRKYRAKDYLGKFNQRLQYYPNPTSRFAATNWSANPIIIAINKEIR